MTPPLRRPIPNFPFRPPLTHKRYPLAMTIALGFLTPSHLVFAADSQETLGEDMKTEIDKIAFDSHLFTGDDGTPRHRAIIATGAGNSEYLRYMFGEITTRFKERNLTVADFDRYLRNKIRRFHDQHVVPYGGASVFNVQLIVAAQVDEERAMWVTYMGTTNRVDSYAAVGSGSPWARDALRGFVPAIVNKHTATAMAAYASFAAKRHSMGCGMDTRIICIARNGELNYANFSAIRTAEDCFRRLESHEMVARLAVLGMPTFQVSSADESLRELRRQIETLNFYPGPPAWATALATRVLQQPPTGDPSPQPPSPESPGGTDES